MIKAPEAIIKIGFGLNLQTKPNLVKFNFVAMALK
jgi:hypothetical protein